MPFAMYQNHYEHVYCKEIISFNDVVTNGSYVSVNRVSIGSDNDVLPIWRNVIILTSAGLL